MLQIQMFLPDCSNTDTVLTVMALVISVQVLNLRLNGRSFHFNITIIIICKNDHPFFFFYMITLLISFSSLLTSSLIVSHFLLFFFPLRSPSISFLLSFHPLVSSILNQSPLFVSPVSSDPSYCTLIVSFVALSLVGTDDSPFAVMLDSAVSYVTAFL